MQSSGPLTAPMIPAGIVARQVRCSKPCIVYTRNGMAEMQSATNESKIRTSVAHLKYSGVKLPYIIKRLKWDETTHRLSNPAAPASARPPTQLAQLCNGAATSRTGRMKSKGRSAAAKKPIRSHARPSRATMSKSGTHHNNPHNCRSAEQIMVSRQDLVFGDPKLGEPDKAPAIIASPACLANNSAPSINAGHEAQ